MQTLAPSFNVSRVDSAREIHWSAAGLWTEAVLQDLQSDLLKTAKPFLEDQKGFRVLGDLREMAVQPGHMAEKMRQSQEASAALGVDRMALVYSSMLVRQQFRRVSEALNCEFFEDRVEAIAWLRS
ncbi:MAG: STAS/SEC14 domain-containing protein [Pseudomonadota bacterium]